MEEVGNLEFDAGTAATATIVAAGQVAKHWLASSRGAANHLPTGWHVAVEVTVTTDPVSLRISFVDPGTGERFVQEMVQIPQSAIFAAT